MARVCVELDLVKERVDEIILNIIGKSFVQKVIYEYIPPYCQGCKHIEHLVEDCYADGNKPRPPPRMVF